MADGNQGPHRSYIEIAKPFLFDSKVHESYKASKLAPADDTKVRLQGVAWIDSVRKAMRLPVRTYNTAAVYYHKFRLVHPDANGYIDAAGAALFAACKIEDTLKKSREILCTAYNLKAPVSERLTPDAPAFEAHSKTIIGLERLMLEASGFDFRNRYPQRYVLKIAKFYDLQRTSISRTAFNISIDLYRTFIPLKQTSAVMAMACVELATRLHDERIPDLEAGNAYERLFACRNEVMETLLDLLDLYTENQKQSAVGPEHPLDKFLSIRIALNKEAETHKYLRHIDPKPKKLSHMHDMKTAISGRKDLQPPPRKRPRSSSNSSVDIEMMTEDTTTTTNTATNTIKSPSSASSSKGGIRDGTVRFMLDAGRARDEQAFVGEYFETVDEEYVVEVPVEMEREKERPHKERDRNKDHVRDRDRDRERDRDRTIKTREPHIRERDSHRHRDRDRDRERDGLHSGRDRDRERERGRDRNSHRERDRDRDDRNATKESHRDRERVWDSHREKDRDRERDRGDRISRRG